MTENKGKLIELTKNILPQLLFQTITIVFIALSSFMFMTWLVTDIFGVKDTYEAAGYSSLGTLVIFILTLAPLNAVLHRKRVKEVTTLYDAIRSVADGNYSIRIPQDSKGTITPIYSSFNKMCAELESVSLLLNDFINNYSHEFKTPIASINGFASLLLEKKLPPEEQKQYLEIIVAESARLSNLASNTILLSKLSSQQIVTDVEEYDLSEQLRQCSIILSPKWLAKNIDLKGEFTSILFLGNKEMMQHLWINLLDNAIKYTPDGGEISISTSLENEQVVVRIADTGEGMNEETLQSLFNPYFQGDSSHAQQGLGLGLSIAKRVVELCQGTITVKSEVSAGTSFIVELPLKTKL